MATLQGMSGIDTMAMTAELRSMLPLWIGKIYQFGEKSIGIRLGGEHAKHLFFIESGRRAHLTGAFPPAPKNPTGFAMLLRKHLEGGKVLAIGQFGIERIFYLEIGKRDQVFRLIVELFDEGNVILCREDGTIVMPLWHHRFRDREVVPGAIYTRTGHDCTELDRAGFAVLIAHSERELVRVLATDCMLGGKFAEEICRDTGMEKSIPAREADPDRVYDAFHDLLERVTIHPVPVITGSGSWPVLLEGETPLRQFDSFNAALDSFYPPTLPEVQEKKAKISRQETIRSRQIRAIAGFEEKVVKIQRKIDALYAHYPLVNEILQSLRKASTRYSWQEIATRIQQSDGEAARKVVQVYPEEGAVDIDLGERVKVYVSDTIEGNTGRYYAQMKKLKKKREGALTALQKPVQEAPKKAKARRSAKARWYHRFRWFFTSDGVLVVGGKDAGQNEELVKKYLEGGDTFVHADVHGASVVVIKGHTEHPEEAAQEAVSYSGSWKSGQFSADAYAVAPEQVSKAAPSGEFVGKGGFIVRGERTYFRNISLAVAIGLQVEPETQVIGGPPAAVAKRAAIWVVLHPGGFEPNDIAKRVVRVVKEKARAKGIADINRIITTEAVAAFVPPGGSDIVEEHEG